MVLLSQIANSFRVTTKELEFAIAISGYFVGSVLGLTKYAVRKKASLDTALDELLELKIKLHIEALFNKQNNLIAKQLENLGNRITYLEQNK